MDNDKVQNGLCTCKAEPVSDERIDISRTTVCPYCGMRFETPREVLVHVFHFHTG